MHYATPAETPLSHAEIAELEDRITELAAHIHAANYRLLTLIRQFDEAEGWAEPGLRSCAHWLNWKCGIGLNAAREKIRVAHALAELPEICSAFSKGKVSYSKVRAMTRVATAENEEFLLMIALHGTAAHVERAVRQFRRAKRGESLEAEKDRHARRRVVWRMDEDGSWCLYGRFTPEQGERIQRAIDVAMDEIEAEQENVTAETSEAPDPDQPMPCPVEQRRADALERLADGFFPAKTAACMAGTAARCMCIPTWTPCVPMVRVPNRRSSVVGMFLRKRRGAWGVIVVWWGGLKRVGNRQIMGTGRLPCVGHAGPTYSTLGVRPVRSRRRFDGR